MCVYKVCSSFRSRRRLLITLASSIHTPIVCDSSRTRDDGVRRVFSPLASVCCTRPTRAREGVTFYCLQGRFFVNAFSPCKRVQERTTLSPDTTRSYVSCAYSMLCCEKYVF